MFNNTPPAGDPDPTLSSAASMPLHVYTPIICVSHLRPWAQWRSGPRWRWWEKQTNLWSLWDSEHQTEPRPAASLRYKPDQCSRFSEGGKKGPSRNPADLTSYFYILLQLLCPSTRQDPRNPGTKRQKGIIMAKMAGISQLQEEAAGVLRVMGCQCSSRHTVEAQNATKTEEWHHFWFQSIFYISIC